MKCSKYQWIQPTYPKGLFMTVGSHRQGLWVNAGGGIWGSFAHCKCSVTLSQLLLLPWSREDPQPSLLPSISRLFGGGHFVTSFLLLHSCFLPALTLETRRCLQHPSRYLHPGNSSPLCRCCRFLVRFPIWCTLRQCLCLDYTVWINFVLLHPAFVLEISVLENNGRV